MRNGPIQPPPVSTRKLPYLLRYHRARAGKTALLSDNEKTLLQTILAGLLHEKTGFAATRTVPLKFLQE